MYFSLPEPYSGPIYSRSFFLIFVSVLLSIFLLYYSKFYFLPYKPIWCFTKTWCNLVLLHFLINISIT